MPNKREYWLTKTTKSLTEAYDFLSEASSLIPSNEEFDNAIEENLELLYNIRRNLELLKEEQQK